MQSVGQELRLVARHDQNLCFLWVYFRKYASDDDAALRRPDAVQDLEQALGADAGADLLHLHNWHNRPSMDRGFFKNSRILNTVEVDLYIVFYNF